MQTAACFSDHADAAFSGAIWVCAEPLHRLAVLPVNFGDIGTVYSAVFAGDPSEFPDHFMAKLIQLLMICSFWSGFPQGKANGCQGS